MRDWSGLKDPRLIISSMAHGWMVSASFIVVAALLFAALDPDRTVTLDFNVYGEAAWEIPLMLIFLAFFVLWYFRERVWEV